MKSIVFSKTAQTAYFKGLAAVGQLALSFIVARLLGVELAGVFFIFLSVVIMLAILCRFGFENSIVKYVSAELSQGNVGVILPIYIRCMFVVLLSSLFVLFVCSLLMPQLQNYFFEQKVTDMEFYIGFSSVLFLALSVINAEFIRALGRPQYHPVFVALVPYCLTVFLLIFIFFCRGGLVLFDSLLSYLFSCVTSFVISSVVLFKIWPLGGGKKKPSLVFKQMIQTSKSFYTINIMNGFYMWGLIPVTALFTTSADSGGAAVAMRLANMVSFILNVLVIKIGPEIAVLYASEQYQKLFLYFKKITVHVSLLALVIGLILIAFSSELLALFGKEFAAYSSVFVIFLIGQLFGCIAGPAGVVLSMTGKEKELRNIILTSLVLSVVLLFFLASSFGVIGATVAITVGILLRNFISTFIAVKHIGSKVLL